MHWLERPLRLSGPQPIEVISIVPDGPPLSFRWERREHRIAHYWGPERIETGWWRAGSARRDYYRVETTTGQRLWIFRRLRDGDWFFHGQFE
jgi:protein ImuB